MGRLDWDGYAGTPVVSADHHVAGPPSSSVSHDQMGAVEHLHYLQRCHAVELDHVLIVDQELKYLFVQLTPEPGLS